MAMSKERKEERWANRMPLRGETFWSLVEDAEGKPWVNLWDVDDLEVIILRELMEAIPYGTTDQIMDQAPGLVRILLEEWDNRVFLDGNVFRVEDEVSTETKVEEVDGAWFFRRYPLQDPTYWGTWARRYTAIRKTRSNRSRGIIWDPPYTKEEKAEQRATEAVVHPDLLHKKWLQECPEHVGDPDDAMNKNWETLPEWKAVEDCVQVGEYDADEDDDDSDDLDPEEEIERSCLKAMCGGIQYKLQFLTGRGDKKRDKWVARDQGIMIDRYRAWSHKKTPGPIDHTDKLDVRIQMMGESFPEDSLERRVARRLWCVLQDNPGLTTVYKCKEKLSNDKFDSFMQQLNLVEDAYIKSLPQDLKDEVAAFKEKMKR